MLKRDHAMVVFGLAGVTALSWTYLIYMDWGMRHMDVGMEMVIMPAMQNWTAWDLVLVFLMWTVMMVAMMVPAASPVVLLFAEINRRRNEQQGAFVSTAHFLLGYLTAWPAGQGQPLVSTLNAPTGTVTANAAIVPAGNNGDISVFVTNDSDLVIDINGYFAPPGPGGLSFFPLAPCRVLDTRNPPGTLPFSGTLNVNVAASGCGAPMSAQSYVFNATAVPPSALGFLTMWPQGAIQPLVSTLNAVDGSVTSNMAIVPTMNGSVSAFAANPTHLVLDISGYFAP